MNTQRILRGIQLISIAALTLFSAATFAAEELPTVTVTAGVMIRRIVGRAHTGIPIEEVQLTDHVTYSDLDLSTHIGAMALHRRVEDTARSACAQLAKLYPRSENDTGECVSEAITKATPQVTRAIESAERKRTGR